MIQEIFKILNQYAMDIHTLSVNQCLSHPIQFLVECSTVLWECRVAEKGPPNIWDTHVFSGNVFVNPDASSSAPHPQELNPWRSSTEEPLQSSTVEKSESQTPVEDQRCQSGPSAKSSVIPGKGDSVKNYAADQQRLQISNLHFDKFPTPATFVCWKIGFKTEGMYLDQSGDD